MKKIAKYSSQIEGHIACQALVAAGIRSELVGAKEYSSVVLGTDLGSYDLFVETAKFDEAQVILNKQKISEVPQDAPVISSKSFLKKAIMFSFLGAFLLPVIFNYSALRNLHQYLKFETNKRSQIIWTIVVILLQLPLVFYIYVLISLV